MDKKQNDKVKRWIGNVKEIDGQFGKFWEILFKNVYPTNKDGSVNEYHQGALIWCDKETGKKYLVKKIKMHKNDEGDQYGRLFSLNIELSDSWSVDELT